MADRPAIKLTSSGLSRNWLGSIRSATQVIAYSPYITSCAATDALVDKGPACTLYTQVTAENYSSGACQMACLRKLVKAGVRVFHLPTLHAKILLVPGVSVTIGSQNMTGGGMRNQEATLAWDDPRAAKAVRAATAGWLNPPPARVNNYLLDLLDKELARLRREHRKWRKSATKATVDVWEDWRREEERKRLAGAGGGSRPGKQLKRGEVTRYAKEVVRGRIVSPNGRYMLSNEGSASPLPPSYLLWQVQGRERDLVAHDPPWYPSLDLDSGRFGWARTTRTRISFIASYARRLAPVTVGDVQYRVQVYGRSSAAGEADTNLCLRAKHVETGGLANIDCRYEVDTVHAQPARPVEGDTSAFDPGPFEPLIHALNVDTAEVVDQVLALLLARRTRMRMADHNRIDQRLGRRGTVFTGLRLVRRKWPLLVFSRQHQRALSGGVSGHVRSPPR